MQIRKMDLSVNMFLNNWLFRWTHFRILCNTSYMFKCVDEIHFSNPLLSERFLQEPKVNRSNSSIASQDFLPSGQALAR